ncbi:MoxR family ATPase [Pseudomonas sp.]|nr:MoxR family ATPase [Pseudomonas sp.]MDP2748628.1 MoxR family ATPase [Pseudomonas sp.]
MSEYTPEPLSSPAVEPLVAAAPAPAPSNPAQQRQRASQLAQALRLELHKALIGQNAVVDDVLTALIAGGHVLIEGVPGLGKTLLVRALARCFGGEFARIQFTPDLMPSDITGHAVYDLQSEQFKLRKGPVFTNLLLADEINRAPAKTQAALLEVMQERQVTLEGRALAVPLPFMVLATQNPIEQEGTYPLPEAQLDRFLMHVKIGFPDASVERKILAQARGEALNGETKPEQLVSQQAIFAARQEILGLYMADAVEEYLVQLVMASRTPAKFDPELAEWIAYGASPRGSIALDRCSRAHAWLAGRDFVSPEDIQAVLFDVLRHRIILSFEAEAAGIDQDRVVQRILDVVAVA